MPRHRIAVLLHENHDDFEASPYMIRLIAEAWESRGLEVVWLRGTSRYVEADVVVQHVDLTVVPEPYRRFLERYPAVVNGSVLDISKRVISRQLVVPGDSYDGPVIVKSDLNTAGGPEHFLLAPAALRRFRRSRAGRFVRALARRSRGTEEYRVYRSVAEVPGATWRDRSLVVERFLPEREGEGYALRRWICFGAKAVNRRTVSPVGIIRAHLLATTVSIENDPAVTAAQASYGLDYGKIDYAVHEGKVVVFDVNKTPTWSGGTPSAAVLAMAQLLADGIAPFLG